MRVDEDVVAVLSAAECAGSHLKLRGQLDRRLYVRTAAAIEEAGGKWNRKVAAHVFEDDAADAIEPILLTGEIVSTKRQFDAFYTPDALACEVVRRARVRNGASVLEPSAGRGALAVQARAAGGDVTCAEIDPKSCDRLEELGFKVWRGVDFLNIKPQPSDEPKFNYVVMNPPFSRGQDAKHVLHALRFLKPAGRLVAIMSAGVKFRKDGAYGQFAEYRAARHADYVKIEDLPEGAFEESGTGVSTVLVTIEAP